jgi:hypothetical protein
MAAPQAAGASVDEPPQRRNNPGDLKRKWPHHVALPAEKVRDRVNREVT